MSTRFKEKYENIKQIITELAEESAKGIPIIVEGKKDVLALRFFNVSGPIIEVKTGGKSFLQALYEIEKTATEEAILLLDFDRRGKQGTQQFKKDLEHVSIKPNLKFWLSFYALVGRDIQSIESLKSYMLKLEKKYFKL